jgi:hypothetical protein
MRSKTADYIGSVYQLQYVDVSFEDCSGAAVVTAEWKVGRGRLRTETATIQARMTLAVNWSDGERL